MGLQLLVICSWLKSNATCLLGRLVKQIAYINPTLNTLLAIRTEEAGYQAFYLK